MAFRLARRFADDAAHLHYHIQNGTVLMTLRSRMRLFLEPEGKRLADKVVVLTNRTTYSAGNFFAAMMKAFPNVTLIGDRTGGGVGQSVGWELPNGWATSSSSITWLPGWLHHRTRRSARHPGGLDGGGRAAE